MFFAVIIALVTREQILANRHGVAAKGDGPLGGRRNDYAWAGAGLVAVLVLALGLSRLHASATVADDGSTTADGTTATIQQRAGAGSAKTATSRQPRPATRLGDLSRFATIVADVQGKVTKDDLAGAKTRVKDLEVTWDDAEAGLKPRDPAKWHELDDEIDAVLTDLRVGSPRQSDCAASLATLAVTLDKFDGV
jgi:hypothetical protein